MQHLLLGTWGDTQPCIGFAFDFFWRCLRFDVAEWVKGYPNCMLTYRWRRRGRGLMFSLPISSPSAIFHVDLWMPGYYTDINGYMALMNIICDMCQFLVVVPVPNETFATLASYFMQHILSKFGLCHLDVLDNGNSFKGDFITMCESLTLNHDVLTNRNHKCLTVKHFYCFLNKSITIAAEDHGTNYISVPTGVGANCAWNSTLIDGTDIHRSIPAIGCELQFSLDISLNTLSKLMHNEGQAALDYLKLTESSRHFSTSIMKIFIEDRRTVHAEHIYNNRNLVILNTGDIVMARTAIQSGGKKINFLSYVMQLEVPTRFSAALIMVVTSLRNCIKLITLS